MNGIAQESGRMDVNSLFASYLKNDLETRRLAAEVEKQILSQQSTEIVNGFDIELSTGTVRFSTGKNSDVEFRPSATIKFPQLQNLSATANSTVNIGNAKTTANTSLSIGVDIISGAKETRNVALLKAERGVLEAKRALQNRALSAERDFYNSLRTLYQTALSIVTAQNDLYDDKTNLEKIQAQGYSASSSQYRTAQMKVLSDEYNVRAAQRELESETSVFAAKCGVSYAGVDAIDFLPTDIPLVQAIDIRSFDKSKFSEIESAEWNHYINGLSRKADKNFSLSVNGGYTFSSDRTNARDTVDAGVSAKYNGLNVTAGTNIPVGGEDINPSYTLSLSLSPNSFRTRAISEKQNELTEEQELIAIEKANRSYETNVLSNSKSLEDIEWKRETTKEYFDMYTKLEADNARWLDAGIMTESEYRASAMNKEKYRIQMITNEIDLILYNDEIKLLFCRDDEIR